MLGACILSPDLIDSIGQIVQAQNFYAASHRIIWQQISAMREINIPCDVVSLARRLSEGELLQEVGGAAYLNQLMECATSLHNTEFHAQQIAAVSLRREIIERNLQVTESAYDFSVDRDSLLLQLESSAVALTERRAADETRPIANDLAAVIDRVYEGCSTGIMTGLTDLDQITTGMHAGQLIVVAARPGMGKTALAMTLAYELTRGEIPVLFHSLEMPRDELIMRLLALDTGVSVTDMRRGTVPPDQRESLIQAASLLYDLPLYINDRSLINVMQIAASARLAKRRWNIGCLIVDYVQLIEAVDTKASREQQIASMSRSLKLLAKSLGIPVIMLAQLNREVEKRKDKRPMLSDLRESGAIEQDADQVWMLHRQEVYEDRDSAEWAGCHGIGEVLVRKNRNGETGDARLQFEASRMMFRNLSQLAFPVDEF